MTSTSQKDPATVSLLPPKSTVDLEVDSAGFHRVTHYDVEKLTTLSVFFTWTGTIFRDSMLWKDMIFMVFLSISVGVSMHYVLTPEELQLGISAHRKDFQTFTNYLGTLAVFLLGFYTSISVGRWWRLRTNGIGNIWSATSQLTLYISTFVTRDPEVLAAIQRVGRGSMALVFKQQQGTAQDLNDLHEEGILTEEEVECLKGWHSNLAESIWTWAAALVHRLHRQGLIKNDQVLWTLMDRVNLGRSGAALIGAQQGTQLPMQYVHLLGLLVKLYTLVLTITTGLLVTADLSRDHNASFQVGQEIAKAIVLPFLYNALLVINCQIANPFGTDTMDFPKLKYLNGVKGDSNSYVNASNNRPSWLSKDAKPLDV